MMSPSGHYDRDSVLHDAADDFADWGLQQHRVTAIRMSEQYRREQEAEAERIRVLFESAGHFASCKGASCHQGRQPCRDRCHAEMACAEPEPDTSKPSLLRRLMNRWGL